MSSVLLDVARWAMLAFLLAGMLECGLGLTLRQVLTPLRDTRRVILLLVANFLIVPFLAAGETHTCSLQRTGVLTCWGGNQDGEVGDGTTAQRDLAFTVSPTEDWTAVAAGHHHTCAIRADNTLWCWGRNSTGQLGVGTGGQITP